MIPVGSGIERVKKTNNISYFTNRALYLCAISELVDLGLFSLIAMCLPFQAKFLGCDPSINNGSLALYNEITS